MDKARVKSSLSDPWSRALSTFHAAFSNSDFWPFRCVIQGTSFHLSVLICKMKMIMLTWHRWSDIYYVFYSSRLFLLGTCPSSTVWLPTVINVQESISTTTERHLKQLIELLYCPGHSVPKSARYPGQLHPCCYEENAHPSKSLIWALRTMHCEQLKDIFAIIWIPGMKSTPRGWQRGEDTQQSLKDIRHVDDSVVPEVRPALWTSRQVNMYIT